MEYLDKEDIIAIHDEVLEKSGGLKGVLNEHALLMLEVQPKQGVFGQELYPDIYLKSAFYLRAINKGHIFTDGNKRTSMVVVQSFLEENNYSFELEDKELEDFALYVANSNLTLEEIALWIKDHSKIKST